MTPKLSDEADHLLTAFLELIERDIATGNDSVVFATEAFAEYLSELTEGIVVDYDAPIEGEFEF